MLKRNDVKMKDSIRIDKYSTSKKLGYIKKKTVQERIKFSCMLCKIFLKVYRISRVLPGSRTGYDRFVSGYWPYYF